MAKVNKIKFKGKKPSWLKAYHEDNKRNNSTLKESFEHGVKAIGEQYFDLKKDIKKINETLNSHTEMIGGLMIDVEGLKKDVGTLKQDIRIVKSDVQIIKTDLEPRVTHLEVHKR